MSVTRRHLLHVVAAGGAVLAGCSGGSGGGGGAENQAATPSSGTVVEMVDRTYRPLKLAVSPGATVTWTNEDSAPHTVTATQFHDGATPWSLDERVAAGERVAHTFESAGVYEYYCTVHGERTMCGAILVGDATLDESLPCAGGGGGGGGYY